MDGAGHQLKMKGAEYPSMELFGYVVLEVYDIIGKCIWPIDFFLSLHISTFAIIILQVIEIRSYITLLRIGLAHWVGTTMTHS